MRVWAFYAYVCNKHFFLYVGQATNGLSWARKASELGSRGYRTVWITTRPTTYNPSFLCSEVKEWTMDLPRGREEKIWSRVDCSWPGLIEESWVEGNLTDGFPPMIEVIIINESISQLVIVREGSWISGRVEKLHGAARRRLR
jgi:hypothetical protein